MAQVKGQMAQSGSKRQQLSGRGVCQQWEFWEHRRSP